MYVKKKKEMASFAPPVPSSSFSPAAFAGRTAPPPSALALGPAPAAGAWKGRRASSSVVVSAVGDVSADGTTYLVAGAVAVALLGTAFPILFSRKDLCPECDGAGFIRKADATLRANAARKDQAQIVCPRCNGLGKLGQVDK